MLKTRKKKLRVRLPTAPPARVHRPKSAYRRKKVRLTDKELLAQGPFIGFGDYL